LVIKKAWLFGDSLRLNPSGLSRNIAPGDAFKARIARSSWLLRRFATQSRDFFGAKMADRELLGITSKLWLAEGRLRVVCGPKLEESLSLHARATTSYDPPIQRQMV